MADLNVSVADFDRFKVFFQTLKENRFGKIAKTTDALRCLDLLRSLPVFQGEQFKDEKTIFNYLQNPARRSLVLQQLNSKLNLNRTQEIEITEALEKPVAAGVIREQPSAEGTPSEQVPAASASGGTPAGGMPGIPGMPAAPTISLPRVIKDFKIPHTPPPTAIEGGPGQGIAATSKIDRLEAERVGAATAKINRLETGKATVAEVKSTEVSHPSTPSPSRVNFNSLKGFKIPTSLKTLGSNAQMFASKNLVRIGNGLWNMGKIGTGGAYNFGAKTGSRILDSYGGISGSGPIGGSRSIIGKLGRFGRGSGGGGLSTVGKAAKKRGFLLFLLAILGFMGLVGILGFSGANQPGTTTSGIPTGSSDISQCKFVRGDHNPKEATFKSNLLLSYIQEASQKANIPPVVLAAFIRVESPSSSNMSDDQITNYAASCAESPTKALGIMQIQPPGTTSARGDPASCDDCIDAGARLVGKTVGTLTRADYCDPRTNIIVGAGWILKKMSKLKYGDGTKWDPAWTNDRKAIEALVNTYYGCLNYGTSTDCVGPYNYADDVSASIQSCQAQTATGGCSGGTCTHPTAPAVADSELEQNIINKFGIRMVGFDAKRLRWAWEKLWDVSNTKFPGFVRGSTVQATTPGDSARLDCPGRPTTTIRLGISEDPEWFKLVFIHEFGHVIEMCPSSQSNYWAAFENAFNTEKGISFYAQNANSCTGSNNKSEDYAEMIAYYLNPATNAQTPRCAPAGSKNPNMQVNFPMHYNVAKDILGNY